VWPRSFNGSGFEFRLFNQSVSIRVRPWRHFRVSYFGFLIRYSLPEDFSDLPEDFLGLPKDFLDLPKDFPGLREVFPRLREVSPLPRFLASALLSFPSAAFFFVE
jgi:hypothetical protein